MTSLGTDDPNPAVPPMLQRYLSQLNDNLRDALTQGNSDLLRMLHYHMGWVNREGLPTKGISGKGLRPALCLFTCHAVGGSLIQAMPAAVALELIHNFSLIHDDIQDGDRERHSRETLWAVWGQGKALIAGNAMRTIADLSLLRFEQDVINVEKNVGALVILTGRYLEMIEGQYLDLSFESRLDVLPEEYLGMIGKKTAALLEASMHIGAYCATDNPDQLGALRRCGYNLGLAFQIRDDYLGVWGDETTIGKPVGTDVARKKKSLPISYTFNTAKSTPRIRLEKLYHQERLSPDSVAEVLDIMEDLGAKEYTQKLAEEQRVMAINWAKKANLPEWAQKELEDLADFIVNRRN
ncbi:polyprenyl synthetase family protein [SAR202 cluster bacterium AD-802-E10_MRT_200m]|nr:polyprenyl synthetase family protein [SAR202 cluster bacterium AD-802-E10_MRT_200m]